MPEFGGYTGRSLELLKEHGVRVGDSVKISADLTHDGIIMPRYEHADDMHIVVKLGSGYNISIELEKISAIQKTGGAEARPAVESQVENNPDLPDILLLSTGGTIASKVDYRTGAVTPTLTAQELDDSVPELSEIANVEARVLFSEYSENIVPRHWLRIAEGVREAAGSEKYSGIIVAHGTDTMHYTSSFLSFALAGLPIPVALVGSQRSSDRASSDAALNLIGAARFLTRCNTNGVYVVMHQDGNDGTVACHLGTRVRKNHTSKRGAFQTVGGDPAFLVVDGSVHRNSKDGFFSEGGFRPRIQLDEKVMLVKYFPGLDPDMLEKAVDSGCRAIIFEGTGLGHVGKNMYPAIRRAGERGVFMGMTSQCIGGRVRMTVYESGRDLLNLGIVPLEDMIPETALVKAMWAAGMSSSQSGIKDVMLSKIASEFSD